MPKLPDDLADAAIHEIFVRAGQRKPDSGDDYRWAAEGKRRLVELDSLKDWFRR